MDTREKDIFRVTIIGTVVNAALVVMKLAAGIIGRSSALVADAIHSLTDFATDIVVLIFVHLSGKPRDEDHRYGHGKYETLATLIIGILLIAAGIGLMINGIEHVISSLRGEILPHPSWIALVVALISILSKEVLFRYTLREGDKLNSDAVKANAWHHRSDVFSSVGTAIGICGAMFLGEKWRILDPIAAVIVSALIVKAGYDIVRPALSELLETSLPKTDIDRITGIIRSVAGVKDYHHLRTRKIGNSVAIDVHVKMDGNLTLIEAHDIASRIERKLRVAYGPDSIISIHMEPYTS